MGIGPAIGPARRGSVKARLHCASRSSPFVRRPFSCLHCCPSRQRRCRRQQRGWQRWKFCCCAVLGFTWTLEVHVNASAEPPLPPPVSPPPHSPYPSCPAAVPSQMSRHRRLHAPAAPAPRCFATAALFAPRGTAARQMPNALGIGPIKTIRGRQRHARHARLSQKSAAQGVS